MATMIKTTNVKRYFPISGESPFYALKGIDITIPSATLTILKGRSGSGKTTLLNIIASDSFPSENIKILGKLYKPRDCMIASLKPIRSKKPLIELMGENDIGAALRLLGIVGLSEPALSLKRFDELSRGQQYRAMLANLINSKANLWIADEFCANLDIVTANIVANKIESFCRKNGVTLVVAASSCSNFLTSLKPDRILMLNSNWEHCFISGLEFEKSQKFHFSSQLSFLKVMPGMIAAIENGKKRATIRKGRKVIGPGLLVLSDGKSSIAVRIKSSICKSFKNLTDEDAVLDGYRNKNELAKALRKIYPDLRDRSLVTIIKFERIWGEREEVIRTK